jgi:methylglyoxal synthase
VARWSPHGVVPGGAAPVGVAGGIVRAAVGLDFHDAAAAPVGGDEHLAEQIGGHL